jgi:hypothetical protein
MKKIRILILALMIFALTACGEQPSASTNGGVTPGSTNADDSSSNPGAGSSSLVGTNSSTIVSFAQEGDVTLISITSPYVSQFTEEALKLSEEEIYQANFNVHFNNQDDWEQGFGVSFNHQHSFIYVDNQEVASYTSRGHFSKYANDIYLNSDEEGLVVEINGNKAEWYISGVELSLDNITDVSINAGLVNEISDPDDYLFSEYIPVAQVAVSNTVPVADVTALPFDITGMYAGENGANEEDNALFYVTPVPGGYEIASGDFKTGPLQPEISHDEYSDQIRFQSNTTNGHITAYFTCDKDDPTDIRGSFDKMDSSGTSVYLQGGKVYLRPGSFMYWDWDDQTTKTAMTYEYEDGKFRFTITDGGYTSDWLEPEVYAGLRFAFTSGSVEINVVLRNITSILEQSADVEIVTNGVYDSVYAYPEITKEDVANIDLAGTYYDYDDPERTLVITQDTVTMAGRFTCARDDAAFFNASWKPLTLTDQASGEKLVVWIGVNIDSESFKDGVYIPSSINMSKRSGSDDSLNWNDIYMMRQE